MEEIYAINQQRNEIQRRIQERQRMMDLIRNKNLQQTTNIAEKFTKIQAINKIQRAYRLHRKRIEAREILKKERENAKYKFQSSKLKQDLDFIFKLIRIQKKIRHHLMVKKNEEKRKIYLKNVLTDYYKEIDFQRGVELRKDLYQRLKITRPVREEDQEDVKNEYVDRYRDFCLLYDEKEKVREDNWMLYLQNKAMVNYMSNKTPDSLNDKDERFTDFVLDYNKMPIIKKKVDNMEYSYMNNDLFDGRLDDTEERNILDEIDNKYNYERWEDILKGN